MCKSIEDYATDLAIDATIRACIFHNHTLEETIKCVLSQYENTTEAYITSRFNVLLQESK